MRVSEVQLVDLITLIIEYGVDMNVIELDCIKNIAFQND